VFGPAVGLEIQDPASGDYLGEQRVPGGRIWENGEDTEELPGTYSCTPESYWVDGSPGPNGPFDKEGCCTPPTPVLIEVIGGGGGGFTTLGMLSGGGGGGGAYSSLTMDIVSGTAYSYSLGAAGAGGMATAGGDTWFVSALTLMAKGGGAAVGGTGGARGLAASGFGTELRSGGTGANGVPITFGGGGGGAGGLGANGGNGGNPAGGLGVAPGGNGGKGGDAIAGPAAGQFPGAGGGGRKGGSAQTGQPGNAGVVRIHHPSGLITLTSGSSWTAP